GGGEGQVKLVLGAVRAVLHAQVLHLGDGYGVLAFRQRFVTTFLLNYKCHAFSLCPDWAFTAIPQPSAPAASPSAGPCNPTSPRSPRASATPAAAPGRRQSRFATCRCRAP